MREKQKQRQRIRKNGLHIGVGLLIVVFVLIPTVQAAMAHFEYFDINETDAVQGKPLLANLTIDDEEMDHDTLGFTYNGSNGNQTSIFVNGTNYLLWLTDGLLGNYSVNAWVASTSTINWSNDTGFVWVNFVTTTTIPPHITYFDINETDLPPGVPLLANITIDNGTGEYDSIGFTYDGLLGNRTTVYGNNSNYLLWFTTGLGGNYTVTAWVNTTANTINWSNWSSSFYVNFQTTTTTTLTPLNASYSTKFEQLIEGSPFHAAETTHTDIVGSFFWPIILGVVFVGVWLRTQNFYFPTIMLDLLIHVFGVKIHPDAMILVYAVNVLAVGSILYKLLSPTYAR